MPHVAHGGQPMDSQGVKGIRCTMDTMQANRSDARLWGAAGSAPDAATMENYAAIAAGEKAKAEAAASTASAPTTDYGLRSSYEYDVQADVGGVPVHHFATGQMEEQPEEEDEEFQVVTNIKVPEFMEVFFALTGLSDILYRMEKEKERRCDETFQNPYAEVEELVMSMFFEVIVALVIVFNAALLGIAASLPEGENASMFNIFEHLFTIFFFAEWMLRVTAFGWCWMFEPANAADSLLVFGTGVLIKWVLEPAGADVGNFRILTVLRAVRLIRIARAVRLKPWAKEMWWLFRGLTTSGRSLAWTLVIAFAVMYIFAIAACEFIGRNPSFEDHEYAQELFGNFFRSMFTMLQIMTMDTYCDLVIRPMVKVEPWLAIFFIVFVTVGVFIVMNLVTAIIVENAFCIVSEDKDSVAKEREDKKKRDLKALSLVFMEIDIDGSGELSKDELYQSLKNTKVEQQLSVLEMKVGELEEVWDVLDDGDGLLTIKEFCDGIRRMKGDAQAKDVADVIKKLRTTDKKHKELLDLSRRYQGTLHDLETDATNLKNDAKEVALLFKEMYHRLSSFIALGEKEDNRKKREQRRLEKLAMAFEEDEGQEEQEEESEEDILD